MEVVYKYDDERIYEILLLGLGNNLPEDIYEYIGPEQIDIINIVVKNITKLAIEGSCTLLMDSDDSEIEYDTEFVILFNEEDLVVDVQLSFGALVD